MTIAKQLRATCVWCSPCQPCRDVMAAGADEIERLTAIVERLPTTADGVPITLGMPIFVVLSSCVLEETAWSIRDDFLNDGPRWAIAECYATREAAEKARTT